MKYYYIQNSKNKHIFAKDTIFENAIKLAQSFTHKDILEIVGTEIEDCHSLKVKLYNGEELYKIIDETRNYVEIDGGRWLRSYGDGRYYLNGNQNIKYAVVSINRYNANGDLLYSEPIGYAQV